MDEEKTTPPLPAPAETITFDRILRELEQQGIAGRIMSKLKGEDDFKAVYANNFQFEASVWDLKIMLGQLERHTGSTLVNWHTAVTIPWLQVRLVAYFLLINLAIHEQENGRVNIPVRVMPKAPEPPSGDQANDPSAIAFYEACKKIYEEMLAPLAQQR